MLLLFCLSIRVGRLGWPVGTLKKAEEYMKKVMTVQGCCNYGLMVLNHRCPCFGTLVLYAKAIRLSRL